MGSATRAAAHPAGRRPRFRGKTAPLRLVSRPFRRAAACTAARDRVSRAKTAPFRGKSDGDTQAAGRWASLLFALDPPKAGALFSREKTRGSLPSPRGRVSRGGRTFFCSNVLFDLNNVAMAAEGEK